MLKLKSLLGPSIKSLRNALIQETLIFFPVNNLILRMVLKTNISVLNTKDIDILLTLGAGDIGTLVEPIKHMLN